MKYLFIRRKKTHLFSFPSHPRENNKHDALHNIHDGALYSSSMLSRIFKRCGCDECVTSRQEDSLRHSRSRINAYRALASPSLIALSSKDPILTAFELSWELRRLSFLEHEFKVSVLQSTIAISLYSQPMKNKSRKL